MWSFSNILMLSSKIMSLMSSSKPFCYLFPLFLSCFDSLYCTVYINTAFGIAYLRRLCVLFIFFIFVFCCWLLWFMLLFWYCTTYSNTVPGEVFVYHYCMLHLPFLLYKCINRSKYLFIIISSRFFK